MAKGIFLTLEDLEETDLAVEPVDEVEYIQAQNDLDDHSNVIDDLQESYDNAEQDGNVIEIIRDSIPDTNDSPVESTIIATEALIRKLGLPNYSLESYKDKTNKALKASLEETVEKTSEAKKSLFKKIWEKIVAFFKKAYEFFTGLFKRKSKDVKKKVDDLKTNSAKEAIKLLTGPNNTDTQSIYEKHHLIDKNGKLCVKAPSSVIRNLNVRKDDVISIEYIYDDFKNYFGSLATLIIYAKSITDAEEMKTLGDNNKTGANEMYEKVKALRNKLKDFIAPNEAGSDILMELSDKSQLKILMERLRDYENQVEKLNKEILDLLNRRIKPKDGETENPTTLAIIKVFKSLMEKYRKYLVGVLEYADINTKVLDKL